MGDSYSYDTAADYDWTGEILNEKYIMLKRIGAGSFAAVWLCTDISKKKFYAMKISNPDDYYDAESELTIMKHYNKKKNLHLIDLIDHFEFTNDDNDIQICIVMPLMTCSAYDLIKMYRGTGTMMPIDVIRTIMYSTIVSLGTLNSMGYLHTDIKSDNILVSFTDDNNISEVSKLCNFINKKNVTELISKKSKYLIIENKKKKKNNIKKK